MRSDFIKLIIIIFFEYFLGVRIFVWPLGLGESKPKLLKPGHYCSLAQFSHITQSFPAAQSLLSANPEKNPAFFSFLSHRPPELPLGERSMDLDDLDEPSLPSSRVVRFAPKSSKAKPKPKSEPASVPEPVPKAEPGVPAGKLEVNKSEGTELASKTDVSASNGAEKMEVELKTEAKEEPEGNDPMEKDAAEDTVIREIDVFFNPSIDADTQVGHSV